jgi:hypothetical protein
MPELLHLQRHSAGFRQLPPTSPNSLIMLDLNRELHDNHQTVFLACGMQASQFGNPDATPGYTRPLTRK